MAETPFADRFPRTVKLPDGADVELRLMSADDRDAVIAFARNLPEEDLLFLRVDLTREAVVDDWVLHLGTGQSTSIVAYAGGQLVGYATVHRNTAPWTRRVGELRVNVGPEYRGRGLGKVLTQQIFDVAQGLGLRKLLARMTTDQAGAQAAFRRLGFVPEAVLADYVEDRDGRLRDLVMMTHDIDGHTDTVVTPLRV